MQEFAEELGDEEEEEEKITPCENHGCPGA
jgi:hypothetical protein